MSETTVLSIISKTTDTGDHVCKVNPEAPLWIARLTLCPIDNLAAPSGRVPPGTPPFGNNRTICLNSLHPVFTAPDRFNLSVTYEPILNYKVLEARVVGRTQAVASLFSLVSEGLAELDQSDQALFFTEVLQAVAAPPLATIVTGGGDECAPMASKPKHYGSENGKDGPAPFS